MALSNMLKEPRREITESVIGLALLGAWLVLDYYFAMWLQEITSGGSGNPCPWPIAMIFIGPCATAMILGVIFAAHAIGEAICDSLERNGVRLRPQRRKAEIITTNHKVIDPEKPHGPMIYHVHKGANALPTLEKWGHWRR